MTAFDKQVLQNRLDDIGPNGRTLFALSCAERLFPLYKSYGEASRQGDAGRLRSTLNQLWESMTSQQPCGKLSYLDEYESLIPHEDEQWTPLNPLAENAVAALAYACQCQVDGHTDNALWAAVQGYEAVDYIAHTLEGIEFEGPGAEAAILSNEHVQREIQNQLQDIAELERTSIKGGNVEGLVEAFRRRAESEGHSLASVLPKQT